MSSTGTYSRAALTTRRLRSAPRAVWLGARARNVLNRPRRLLAVGTALFLGILLSYLFLPAGAHGVLNLFRGDLVEWRDTTLLKLREDAARQRLTAADSALAYLRFQTGELMASITTRSMTPAQAVVRDSVAAGAAALGALLQRAENAPLPESFRSLARSPLLVDDPRVRALADSLTDIERERDELGSGATVDPVFVALTTQANELGRRITTLGEARLAALARQVLSLEGGAVPTAADSSSVALPDSIPLVEGRKAAWIAYEVSRRSFETARRANATADSVAAGARARNQLAPIPILVVGALILAAAFTFAIALVDEMRSPRVADGVEAERLTGLRMLGVARLRSAVPAERTRRAADRTMPALLDPTFDTYRVVAWHLASQWPKNGIVTVTGDNALVAATVASNLAAVMANDARVTLLIDADLPEEPVRRILGLPRSPGLSAVLENRRKWSESLVGVAVGRGRTIDVLPAGGREAPLGPAESQALVGEIQRAARRHDVTIVVTSLAGAKRFRAGDDVLVCATQTSTRLATLARTVVSLIEDGARVRGVVLWHGSLPVPPRAVA